MSKTIFASTITTVLVLGFLAAYGQAPDQPKGVLGILHAGQSVSVRETNGGFEVSTFENGVGILGQKVVDVGADYLVVQDVIATTETRIPIYSIKAVISRQFVR